MYKYKCENDKCVVDSANKVACTSGKCIGGAGSDTWGHACDNCKIINQAAPHADSCDDGSGHPLENYCKCDSSGCKEYKYGCDGQGKCVLDTGTACASGACEAPYAHSSGSWSHRCQSGAGTKTMVITIVKPADGDKTIRTCQKVSNGAFKVTAEALKSGGLALSPIDISMSDAEYFSPATGATDTTGAFYTQFWYTGKIDAETAVTVTAKGTDTKKKEYADASDTNTYYIQPNQLALRMSSGKSGYVYSSKTGQTTVKSCENITFSGCVLDQDGKKVQKDVKITFTLKDDSRGGTKDCTVKANTECCEVNYTAPAVDAEKTFTVEAKATAVECYKDSWIMTSTLTVKPVKLFITSLTANPSPKVRIGEKVTLKAIVMDDGTPSEAVKDIEVTFTVGTATGKGKTNEKGEASADIVAKEPAGKVTVTVKASNKPCYQDSVDGTDKYSPRPLILEITANCAEACKTLGKGSKGCVAKASDCGGQTKGETNDCTGKICCCTL
jgi:hypothetical protein